MRIWRRDTFPSNSKGLLCLLRSQNLLNAESVATFLLGKSISDEFHRCCFANQCQWDTGHAALRIFTHRRHFTVLGRLELHINHSLTKTEYLTLFLSLTPQKWYLLCHCSGVAGSSFHSLTFLQPFFYSILPKSLRLKTGDYGKSPQTGFWLFS